MQWWGWIIFGAFLLGAELLGVDAAFYLIFIGFSAIVVGLLEAFGLNMAPWVEWLVFAALALTFMVLFRKRLYTKFRGVDTDYKAGPVGSLLKLETDLPPGDTCRMQYRGTTWTVVNASSQLISQGNDARITRVDGTTLAIGPAAETSAQPTQ